MKEHSTHAELTDLAMTDGSAAKVRANEIRALPYVTDIVLLPDLHIKKGMEAPSSMVTGTKGVIAPHLASAALNCGMGYIATNIDAKDVTKEQSEEILIRMNAGAAKTKFSANKYSWSQKELARAMLEGARPLLKHYGLEEAWLSGIENNGMAASTPVTEEGIKDFVPHFLRTSRFCRSEIGINFAGNHFLEVQVVDRIDEPSLARKWGLLQGKLGIMYHLGPGPLGGNLMNIYESRKKPPFHYKAGYAFFRCMYQAFKGWRFWNTFGRFNPWLEIDEDSPQGRAFAMVVSIVTNYAYAYRTGTLKALVDTLEGVFHSSAKDLGVRLVADVSHNTLQSETHNGESRWVSRHNNCRPIEGFPGIIAGSNDACSCIVRGLERCGNSVTGYDHGVGTLLKCQRTDAKLKKDPRDLYSVKVRMLRGTNTVVSRERFGIYDTALIDEVVNRLSRAGIVQSVAHVRPLMTLKMVR